MKNKKLIYLVLAVMLLPLSVRAQAQQPKKVPRIGYLSAVDPAGDSARSEAFRLVLRELGYVEGQNIAIEYRYVEGKRDRQPALAAELVRLKVDIIVAAGGDGVIQAAKNATRTIPIVMAFSGNPIGSGFIATLSRPGGNITGLTSISQELVGKRLEILKEVAPQVSHVAVLGNPENPLPGSTMKEMEATAKALRVRLQMLEVRDAKDFESAFSMISKDRAGALTALPGSFMTNHRSRIVELAAKNRLPAIYSDRRFVEVGGLISYGAVRLEEFRRAATYVDKILKGTKPADLPVEQPMKFELIINLKTAKAIGVTVPQSVLYRADKVIK